MKLLLVGNHTCGNRGDSAILRGIVDSLEQISPGIQLDIISRYALSSTYLIGRHIEKDILSDASNTKNSSLIQKVINRLHDKIVHKIIIAHIENKGFYKNFKIPEIYNQFSRKIEQYDAVIQVGGSFFVDLYGSHQFDHALCAFIAKKPIFMIGHSVGPFQNNSFNDVAKFVFENVESLILRESVSLDIMKKSGIPTSKVIPGVDTAWLVRPDDTIDDDNYAVQHWKSIIQNKKMVAMTFRKLAPFDKRLGITQQEYMAAFASLINHVIASGFEVMAFSTCTGIDSYNNDDRMIALQMKELVAQPDKFHVVMDEFNDLQLGELIRECTVTIGTRLHSAIISMNFGTPAIAINYEHKSLGIMQQLNLHDLAVEINDLINGKIIEKFDYITANLGEVSLQVNNAVAAEKLQGTKINTDVLNTISTYN